MYLETGEIAVTQLFRVSAIRCFVVKKFDVPRTCVLSILDQLLIQRPNETKIDTMPVKLYLKYVFLSSATGILTVQCRLHIYTFVVLMIVLR